MMGFLNTPVINPLHHACYSHSKRLSDCTGNPNVPQSFFV